MKENQARLKKAQSLQVVQVLLILSNIFFRQIWVSTEKLKATQSVYFDSQN